MAAAAPATTYGPRPTHARAGTRFHKPKERLLGLYGAQDLADFEAFGGYSGYRVGISEAGEWMYFVAGD